MLIASHLRLVARTESRSRRAYILPLWLYLSFFDAQSLRSLNGSQPNVDTYSLMTAIYKFGPNSPGIYPSRAGGI